MTPHAMRVAPPSPATPHEAAQIDAANEESRMTNDDESVPPEDPAVSRTWTNLTGRAAVLALVVCVLAISLAYPLREYLAQHGDIGGMRSHVAEQARSVADLRAEEKRWQDPAFVERQARERLHFVMPGETSYVVLEPDEAPAPDGVVASAPRPVVHSPWFTDLWRTVEVAGKE
jgi:cell division protein FtsB